ncbi:MAG TPA: hypothetical protein VGI40_18080 [Pirellulaceae bacterium]|jgi:hypothetical protein
MNKSVDLLCDCLEEICNAMEAGDFGKPGEAIYDELDSLTTLLAFVRDKIDEPATYLALATQNATAGRLMADIHTTLKTLADARYSIEDAMPDPLAERLLTAGKIERATMPTPEAELRSAC